MIAGSGGNAAARSIGVAVALGTDEVSSTIAKSSSPRASNATYRLVGNERPLLALVGITNLADSSPSLPSVTQWPAVMITLGRISVAVHMPSGVISMPISGRSQVSTP